MERNIDKHALRLSHLSVMQQQRALKNLARACRMRNKEKLLNAESAEANTYDWHRKVRLAREARAYNLIRGYLKGLPYKAIEQNLKPSTLSASSLIGGISVATYKVEDFWAEYDKILDWLEA